MLTPMFPLGTVLLPQGYLPLRVFEPRYLEMMSGVLAGDGRFGVVLIARGYEVGGGDVRTDVGTLAQIVNVRDSGTGRLFIDSVGAQRIRITAWEPDDPFPRAVTEPWPDDEGGAVGIDDVAPAVALLRTVLARKAEMNEPAVASTVELSEGVDEMLWQACVCAPVGPHDKQQLLCAPHPRARLERLTKLLDEEADVLAHRLAGR